MRSHRLLLLVALATLCSCGKGEDHGGTTMNNGADTAQLAPTTPPPVTDSMAAAVDTSAMPVITAMATIKTSAGDIEVGLYGEDAPKTVANFVGLAKKKYYDGILFHRVEPGFVIQGGDPNSKDPTKRDLWGSGGESIYGKTFADELNPNTPSYKRGYQEGTLAMANAGPNTNGSQFFIVLSKEGAQHLTPSYTIFGHVTKGMDVAHKIESMAGGMGGTPADPVKILTVTAKEVTPDATAGAATAPAGQNGSQKK